MDDLRLRLKARAYLAVTGLFYLLVGVFYSVDNFRLDLAFQPHLMWSRGFILVGILSLFAWFDRSSKPSCRALYLAAGLAAGFAAQFFLLAVTIPDWHYLLGVVLWTYIASAHFSVALLPDPYLVALFENEFDALLAARNARITDGTLGISAD